MGDPSADLAMHSFEEIETEGSSTCEAKPQAVQGEPEGNPSAETAVQISSNTTDDQEENRPQAVQSEPEGDPRAEMVSQCTDSELQFDAVVQFFF